MTTGPTQGSTDRQPQDAAGGRVADAARTNWIDVWAPEPVKPFMRLARWDRPIGTWLLLWPCWWSLAMAGLATEPTQLPHLGDIVLFGLGAMLMRGAGCTYNDLVDQDFDSKVERTRSRPLPSGQVSRRTAKLFMGLQALAAFVILISFNLTTIVVGVASLFLIAVYPFMKRITYWPQAWLGLTFNWGALMGWTVVHGSLGWPAVVLYAAGFFWTLGYDTIYAHQDKDDDALIGVKSTALLLKEKTKPAMAVFYAIALVLMAVAAELAGAGPFFYVGLAAAALHFLWQIWALDTEDPDNCLKLFRANREFGAIFFAALLLGLI